MNDKSNLSPTRRLFASESFRRHYVSAVENGDQADWTEREQSGNLGRVFVFLLLLHVFLIGAIVLYNIVSDRPKVTVASSMGKAPPALPADGTETSSGATVKRSELSEYPVRSGDTVQSIADATGATTEEIIRLNQLDQNGELYVGRRLQLPLRKEVANEVPAPAAALVQTPGQTSHETTVAAAREVSGKAGKGQPESFKAAGTDTAGTKSKSGESHPAPTLIKAKPVTLQDAPPAETRATKLEDSPPAGKAGSGGSAQKAIPVSPVKLQDAPPKEKPAPKAPPVVAETAKEKPAPAAATGGGRSYEIKGGDTFYSIARKNGINVNELIKANPGTNPSRLKKGMTIKIPAK